MQDRPRLHAPPPPGPSSSRERPKEDDRERKQEVPRGVAVINFYTDPPDEDE